MSRPGARVYIQIRETGEVFELEDFTSIDTDLNLFSTSTASIEIVNNLDKWYTFFSQTDAQSPQTGIVPLLLNVHQSPRFKDVNQKLAALTQALYKLPNGTKAEQATKQTALGQIVLINEYLVFDLMYRVWIDFRGREDLYDLNPPDPVGNLPENWYAGFTGIITSINERFSAGKIENITLDCKDMRRFFEVTQAVTTKGADPLWNDLSSKLATMQAYTNNFSTYLDGAAVVLFLAELVNLLFHPGQNVGLYGDGVFWEFPELQENADALNSAQGALNSAQAQVTALTAQANAAEAIAANNPSDEQAQEQAISAMSQLADAKQNLNQANINVINSAQGVGKSSVVRNYQDALDISPVRDAAGFAGMTKTYTNLIDLGKFNPPSISGPTALKFNKGDLVNYINKQDQSNLPDQNLILDYTLSRYEVDKLIASGKTNGVSTNPYQILISQGAMGFENQRTPASSILSMLANYTGYNIWFDAKGNLIYQAAHYDDFPNAQTSGNDDYDDPSANRGIPFISTGYDSNGKVMGYYGDSYAGDIGLHGPLGLPFHGRNYIIGDESILSWNVSQDEEDVVTAVSITANPEVLPSSNPIDPYLAQKQATSQYTDPNLLRKFGPRYQVLPTLISSEFGGIPLLTAVADGLLRRINHNLENLTLTLNCRPDLQLGRTLYFVERRKLYYITSIQQHYQQGEPLTTVINGQYGHLATDPIGDPFSILFNTKNSSIVKPTTSLNDSSQAADALYKNDLKNKK
jgi:hypothetical protein